MDNQYTIKRKPVAKPTATEYEIVELSKSEEVSASEQPANRTSSELSKKSIRILVAIIVGCTLIILVALAYLTFLWFGGPVRASWKKIVFSNWTTTSVVICALAIRWTSGFQTILSTSIVALMFLRKGVPASKIPRISTIRHSNGGPLDLMLLVSPALWKNNSHLTIICLLTLIVSLALQFSSTLLVSDLAISPIAGPARKFRGKGIKQLEGQTDSFNGQLTTNEDGYITPVGLNGYVSLGSLMYTDPLLSTTPSYPVFAEYTYPDKNKPYSNYPDPDTAAYLSPWSALIDDTEPTIRALLPLTTQENRSQVLSYDGNATLYDARWVCAPPNLENLTLIGTGQSGVLSGSANFSVWLPEFYEADGFSDFACQIDHTYKVGNIWAIFTCCLTGDEDSSDQFGLGGMISALDYKANTSDYYYYDELNYPATPQGIGHTWLVINVTNFTIDSGIASAPNIASYAFNDSSKWDIVMPKSGPWVHLTSSQKHARTAQPICSTSSKSCDGPVDPDTVKYAKPWSFVLDVTMCSSALSLSKNMHISARRDRVSAEPIMIYDGLKQLGATTISHTIEERGLLQLNGSELWRQLKLEKKGPYRRWSTATQNFWLSDFPVHWIFTPWDTYGSKNILMKTASFFWGAELYANQSNEDLAQIMQVVIQTTRSPARAMQAIQHLIFSYRYYRFLDYFDTTLPQTITYDVQAIQPVRKRGYLTVATAIGVHFVLMLYVVLAFGVWQGTTRTLTSINQTWQVFTQVSSLQKELALDDTISQISSSTATDHTINAALKHRGLKNKIFVLEEASHGDGVRFRAKDADKTLEVR